MPELSIEEISKLLRDELETILGNPLRAEDQHRPLYELGVDSVGLVELLVMVEKKFGQALMEAGLSAEHFRSIDDLARVIHDRQR